MAQSEEEPKPVSFPVLSELSEAQKEKTLAWWGENGRLEMNTVALRKIVEDNGFKFVDLSSFEPIVADPSDDRKSAKKGTVNYMQAPIGCHDAVGFLLKAGEDAPLKLHGASTKQLVVSWLECSGKIECLICWEDKGGRVQDIALKDYVILCVCGKNVCLKCVLGLALDRGEGLSYVCPNCTMVRTTLHSLIPFIETVLSLLSLEGLSHEQKQLLYEWTAYDGSKDRRRVEAAHSALQSAFSQLSFAKIRKFGIKFSSEKMAFAKGEQTQVESLFKAALRKVDKRKKKTVSAASSAVPKRASRNGCANCGKSFWDKKAWMGAPKCTNCRRVAYCNSKCRKKHAKAHLKECVAVAKRKPKRKKKMKKRKGCEP